MKTPRTDRRNVQEQRSIPRWKHQDQKIILPGLYSTKRIKLKTKLKILPSRSSMLFSNLVTDLSANSARVSACNDLIYFNQNWEVLNFQQLRIQRMEIKHSTHKMGQKLLVGQYNESWQLTQHMHSESTFESPDVNSNFKMKKL